MREFAEAHALLTRPAPGVPDGVQWFTVAEHGMPDFDEDVIREREDICQKNMRRTASIEEWNELSDDMIVDLILEQDLDEF